MGRCARTYQQIHEEVTVFGILTNFPIQCVQFSQESVPDDGREGEPRDPTNQQEEGVETGRAGTTKTDEETNVV